MREAIAGKLVGTRVRRVEDRRLLTGQGCYVDDVQVPNMAHAAFVRSPHAHARIRSIDVAAARRHPGVVAVITGADIEAITNPFIGMFSVAGLYDPRFYSLARERVRHVGDPVAIVVAESRRVAEDASDLVEVDYEELQAVATSGQALADGAPAIWEKAPDNLLLTHSHTYGDVDAVFADADRVITQRFRQHRVSNQPMETRGIVVEVDAATGTTTVHAATQSAHSLKWALALMSDRQTVRTSVKELLAHRDRPARFVAGVKAMLAANPEMKQGGNPMMGVIAKQMRRDPRRLVDMQRAMVGLLAKDRADRPEVLARDIGGAFGTKASVSREEMAVYAAARHIGRSVKWIEDRNEHLMVGGHARDEMIDISVALRNDGVILGMRAALTLDGGAYPSFPFGATMFAQIMRVMIPGPYRIPVLRFDTTVVATNKATYVAYRGPWAVETWVRERMLDVIAREMRISRADIRLRNIVGPDELPTPMVTGPMLDVRVSAKATLERALDVADFDAWPAAQIEARNAGRILGLGVATFIEAAPGPPGFTEALVPGMGSMAGGEPAHVVLEADGMVSVITQQVPHGQGHETTLAQVAADELGVPIAAVRVIYGDTTVTPFSVVGTGGSRSAALAGGVVTFGARALRDEVLDIAADLLEASRDDLVVEDGNIHVVGTPARGIGFAAVAAEARRRGSTAPGTEAIRITQEYDGGEGGWTQATHVCWVEIDLETGQVTIPRYVVVEDCGEIINPAIVDGQIRGGVAQGVGAVLYEKIDYDASGQFQTGTFMDYLIPTAVEIPDIEIHHVETPSDIPANYRGVGEGGMILAPAALTNAIEDALAHLGVRITEQHLPPTRILELAGVIPR